MAQWFSRSLVGRVRENPAGCLSGLVAMSLQAVAMWLSLTNLTSSSFDANRTAVAQALSTLGIVFLLPALWTAPLRFSRNEPARVNIASRGVRRAASIGWGIILVLTLAQVVAALAGNRGVAFAVGYVVAWLNLIALVGGLVVRVSAVERQR